jgi:hypothetical protein
MAVSDDDLARVHAAIRGLDFAANVQSVTPPWVGTAVAEVLGLDIATAPGRKQVGTLVKRWIDEGGLVVAQCMLAGKLRPVVRPGALHPARELLQKIRGTSTSDSTPSKSRKARQIDVHTTSQGGDSPASVKRKPRRRSKKPAK